FPIPSSIGSGRGKSYRSKRFIYQSRKCTLQHKTAYRAVTVVGNGNRTGDWITGDTDFSIGTGRCSSNMKYGIIDVQRFGLGDQGTATAANIKFIIYNNSFFCIIILYNRSTSSPYIEFIFVRTVRGYRLW